MNETNRSEISSDNIPFTPSPASNNTTQLDPVKTLAELNQTRRLLNLANAEIERRNRNMIALTTFAYRANRTDSLHSLLNLTLSQLLDITKSPVGAMVLVDKDSGNLMIGCHEGLTPELIAILTGRNMNEEAMALMPHLVTGTGALLEYQSTNDQAEKKLLQAGKLTSLASFPLIINKQLVGALLVGLRNQKRFKSSELSFLMGLSQTSAVAIESLHLRERLWRIAEAFLEHQTDNDYDEELTQLTTTVSTAIDISVEDELHQRNMDLQILMSLAEMVNRSLNLSEILQSAVDQTKAILNSDAAWIYMLDEKDTLKIHAHVGLSKNYVHGMRRLKSDDDLEIEVVRTNKPCFVASIVNRPHKIWVDKEGLRALAAVPITRRYIGDDAIVPKWHVMGVLATGIRNIHPYEWSVHEMDLLVAIANQVAIAVEKAQSYADIQQAETSLKGSNEILREINDMLIQKNATFERFIHQELRPALKKANQVLNNVNPTHLTISERQQFMSLHKIIEEIAMASEITLNS